MADQEINIKLNGIAQIRSELKALKVNLLTQPTLNKWRHLLKRRVH